MVVKETDRMLEEQTFKEQELVEKLQSNVVDIKSYVYGTRLHDILKTPVKYPKNIQEELEMSYDEYIVYLLNKHGPAPYHYFFNNTCITKNMKIERFNEGLILHHIAEECGMSAKELLDPEYAKRQSPELYAPKYFVYADYFEHLLLHIKIAEEDIRVNQGRPVGTDLTGARMIYREINRYYATGKTPIANKVAAENIKDRYEEYLEILRWMLKDEEMSLYIKEEELAMDSNGIIVRKILEDIKNFEKKED